MGTGKKEALQHRASHASSTYDVAITDGTYTILLMRESDINIDHEPLLSAMKIGIEAKEQVLNPRPQKDLKEI